MPVSIDAFLALASSVVMFVAFAVYNWQVIRGKSTPNAASWLIWSVAGIVSASSYFVMTWSIPKSSAILTDAVLCSSVFLLALFKKKFEKLLAIDYVVLGGSILGVLIWGAWGSTDIANLFMQGVALVGFVPTVAGLIRRTLQEAKMAWFLWGLAYFLTSIVVLKNFDGNWHNLVSPLFIGVAMHWFVAALTMRTRELGTGNQETKSFTRFRFVIKH